VIITALSFVGLIASFFLPSYLKYSVQGVSTLALFFGLFVCGAIYNNQTWIERVKQMEEKIAKAETESNKKNVQIVERVVTKNKIIKEQAKNTVEYIDREVIKYDNGCVIPKEFIKAHNDAAQDLR
jgi:hypothetical protein